MILSGLGVIAAGSVAYFVKAKLQNDWPFAGHVGTKTL
jgi:hypothetical protein